MTSKPNMSFMKQLAHRLISTLGAFGQVLIWCILFVFYFTPIYFLPLPSWADTLIVLFLMNIGGLADILSLPLWVWAFTRVISEPLTTVSYIFYGVFALYALIVIHDAFVFIKVLIDYRAENTGTSKPKPPFVRVLLWIASVIIAAYGIVWLTGGTLPKIDISVISSQLSNAIEEISATPKPSPAPTAAPKVLRIPTNGKTVRYSGVYSSEVANKSKLTIKTPDDNNYYCIVLVDASKPSQKYCYAFVHSDSEVTIRVPDINLKIYYSVAPVSSAKWYGNQYFFGDTGRWATSDEIFDFSEYEWTITLDKVTNGNWDTDPIDASKVPFL